ncbi:HMG-box [Basidiobolus meristosporus CBS 931.73]|uniref:HMG-box n=1 Tax=Basidiobolus meristosporus CBS 931.73 TaxID=1314790 RepID=A0A1Y1Y5V9_9FUNG|nr:HMG-box [Basidiobolus meristosporus CBS 931.73]|eukprot:ORX93383.1 HMG-box [Basidiobolus meristosporus CBS 931.73]
MSKKPSAATKKQNQLNTTPAEISLSDAAILAENYSNIALCMSRIAEVYKKVVDMEGSLVPKKAPKDPNAPKKPFTPYIQFCNEERERIRKEHPTYTSQDVSRELGTAWKALTDADKEIYMKKYEQENAAYKVELEEYNKHKQELETHENDDTSSEQSVEPAVKEDSEESEEDTEKPAQKKAAAQASRKRKVPANNQPQAKKPAAAPASKPNGTPVKSPKNKEAEADTPVTPSQTPSKKKKNKKKKQSSA